jgi:uncharacterized repeat protein (TIGR01451 family)
MNPKQKCLVLVAAVGLHLCAGAQELRPFTPRYSTDLKGRLVFVSNNIITTKQRSGGSAVAYNQAPPACPTGSVLCKNDNEYPTNIDIDGDPSTYNSSSSQLTLPDCSGVAFAGLYWGAGIAISQGSNGAAPMSPGNWNTVRFRTPNGAYQTITANNVDTVNTVFHGYQSYADVTNLVRSGGSGYYTVANVKCDTVNAGNTPMVNAYGGWTMVVIYRDSTQPMRNLTVFDGMAVVGTSGGASTSTRDIGVSGFSCPPTGDVNARLGVIVYDGDRGAIDGFQMRRNSDGVFADQTAAGESAATTSGVRDAWNSSISDTGSLVTSRIPAHQNTYGYDAHLFKLNNSGFEYLRNNDQSTVIRISTTSEGYVLGVVTAEIDTYEPEMIMENTLTNTRTGGTLVKGDTLILTTRVRNTGTDVAEGVRAEDKLPPYFKYVENSLRIDGAAQTDALNDDRAGYNAATRTVVAYMGQGSGAGTGGDVAPAGASYELQYRITISDNCADIGVTPLALVQQSRLFYQGQAGGTSDSTASRPLSSTQCLSPVSPDTLFLLTGCDQTLPVRLLSFTGQAVGNGALLQWQAQEQGDGREYVLEASADGVQYAPVYQLQPGANFGVMEYDYLDASFDARAGRYYRLLVKSIDGAPYYSHVVRIREAGAPASFSLGPVPAGETVIFRTTTKVERLEAYTAAGQQVRVWNKPVNGQSLSLGGMATGVYFIKAYTANGTLLQKLIKR